MILIENKRTKVEILKEKYPGAVIIDVTSKSNDVWVKLSPFFPVGGIPVPFSPEHESATVEGIWQGLKVFENQGVDVTKMQRRDMSKIKRTTRTLGPCLGHQKGLESDELLGYIEARKLIYVPSYNWMLENRCQNLLLKLKDLSVKGFVVLLDYDTNPDIDDPRKPLSHASLIVEAVKKLLTEEELADWPRQVREMKARAKEKASQKKDWKARWLEMKKQAAVVGNPSQYNPVWVWEQQKAGKKFEFVFFWEAGKNTKLLENPTKNCLSQWAMCNFEVDGVTYNCAEQYMMAEKARIFGDEEVRAQILATDSPETIKKLGREVKGFDSEVWNQHKFNVVVKGNLAKFSQNPPLMEFLKKTGSAVLVEASPYDKVWGIGMKEGDKDIEDAEKWFGINLLGFALMVVRDQL